MGKINWEKLTGKYWRPIPSKEYIVEFRNWREEKKDFGKHDKPPVLALVLDVYSITENGDITTFTEPKEFSTTNYNFIQEIRNIIDKADDKNNDTVYVQMKKSNNGIYSVFEWKPY